MFSDRSASQLYLFANTKKLQIPRKGHQIRGCRFFPVSSRVRPKLGQTQAKSQPKNDEKTMPTPPKKNIIFRASTQSTSEVASEPQKVAVGGCPGRPRRLPRGPRAPLERPRDAFGAPPELGRSAQRVQQGTGDLKTTPWDLKKLAPEPSGTSFWSPRGLFFDMFLYVR